MHFGLEEPPREPDPAPRPGIELGVGYAVTNDDPFGWLTNGWWIAPGLEFHPRFAIAGEYSRSSTSYEQYVNAWMIGPQVRLSERARLAVFARFMVGAAHPGEYLKYLRRSLQAWRSYRTLARQILTDGIGAWERDVPFDVHVFGQNHSLGHFYSAETIPVVEDSYQDVFFDLREIDALGAAEGVGVVTALFPQRFQVNEREWRGTVFQFALNADAFDVELPNRRIMAFCAGEELACFDLLPAMRARASDGLYLPLGDMHWNAKGHRVAAENVARYLVEHAHWPPKPKE